MRKRLVNWLLAALFFGIVIAVVNNWPRIAPFEGALVVGLLLLSTIIMTIAFLLPVRARETTLVVGMLPGVLAFLDVFAHHEYWIAAGVFVFLILCGVSAPLMIELRRFGLDPISRAQARRRQQQGPHHTGR